MAANLSSAASTGRPSNDSSRKGHSHGRGGAGNMGLDSTEDAQIDLETPRLTGEHYTTGRGGLGNITKNTDAEAARRAQDVTGIPPREATSDTHVGRGGAANVWKMSAEEIEAAKWENAKWAEANAQEKRTPLDVGLADKGKNWLLKKVGKA